MSTKIKIIHLEDDLNDAELINEMISISGIDADIINVSTKDDFIYNLENSEYDLILSDYNLPQFDGLQALIETKKRNERVPFIYISGTIGEERAVQCLQLGAMDYVLKSRLDRLAPAIKRALRIIEEIKQREIAEKELNEREAFFRLIFNEMTDAVTVVSKNGKFVFVNDSFLKLFELDNYNILNNVNYYNLISITKDEEDFLKNFDKEIYLPLIEKKITTHNKNQKIIEVSARKIDYRNDKFIIYVLRDITSKKITLTEISKFKQGLDNSGDVIFITDTNGMLLYVNKSFEKIYGWKAEDVLNKKDYKILWSDSVNIEVYKSIWDSIDFNNSSTKEIIYKTKEGIEIEFSENVSCVFDYYKNPIGYMSIQTDITVIKNAERELKKAKEFAEELNKLKSYFLSNVSHELRTPLISILGFSDILISEINNDSQKELLKHIQDGGIRLQNTLSGIIELSKLESTSSELKFNEFDINIELKKIISKYKEEANKKSLALKFESDQDVYITKTDSEIFNSIIEKILINAIKFTNKGEVKVISKKIIKENINYNSISIVDTGKGISEEKINLIFEPFRQESEGLSRDYEGLGLGLTIAQKMIQLLKGKIDIISEIDKGTSVTVLLPMNILDNNTRKRIEPKKNKNIILTRDKTKLPLVLLVEDNEANRIVISMFLRNICNIIEVDNGIDALMLAREHKYDLILMDINLGLGIDGVEVLNRIKNIKHNENTPSIAVTAYVMTGNKEKYLAKGFNYYIAKPFTKAELINHVELALNINN